MTNLTNITPEEALASGESFKPIFDLILKSPNIETYLQKEKIEKFRLGRGHIAQIAVKTGNVEKYLTPEFIMQNNLYGNNINYMINASNNPNKYLLKSQQQLDPEFDNLLINVIKGSDRVNEFLTKEMLTKYNIYFDDITSLILETENPESFINKQKIKELDLDSSTITDLIIATDTINKYLTPTYTAQFGLSSEQICKLAIKANRTKEFLNPEVMDEYGIRSNLGSGKEKLIIASGKIEEYLSIDKINEIGGLSRSSITNLIKKSKHLNDFLFEDEEYGNNERCNFEYFNILHILKYSGRNVEEFLRTNEDLDLYNLNIEDIKKAMPKDFFSDHELEVLKNFEASSIQNVINASKEDRIKIVNILERLNENNSGELRRIKSKIATLVLESGENYEERLSDIEKIYSSGELPEFAKRFLVFRYLHPNFFGESSKSKKDFSKANIPSLNLMSPKERKQAIFIDLLNCSLESNNRELISFFETNKDAFRNILGEDTKKIMELMGIADFKELKGILLHNSKNAHERNIEQAKKNEFVLNKGDFVKGIKDTEFFASMLQNGIVAKDFLGEASSHDATPLDTDVAYVQEKGIDLKDTLKKAGIASSFTNSDSTGKKLGKIILVFSGEDFSCTRTSDGKINENALLGVKNGRKEIFHNWTRNNAQAFGIRTGIGSTNIKYIITNRYVEKLGLEIALNGFYMPIVNEQGELLYTPKMYENFRNKMQGLSHFGLTDFELDKSAKFRGYEKFADKYVERNIKDANNKRSKILSLLSNATSKLGLTLSDKREQDLTPGVVEFIDTGSTGRGTNEPGIGDYDFMVRVDRVIANKHESLNELKQELRESLSSIALPEHKEETGSGDFRYKGVSVPQLEQKMDIDLTFTTRTKEIEYSTDECIKDRLETIKRKSPDDYRIVIANILLAKQFMKKIGAYKKANSPRPEKGKTDTRGGLGAVGIENWILQNGGSFEKASREFLKSAGLIQENGEILEGALPINIEIFKEKYKIWDFGENWTTSDKSSYPHDNFVDNLSEEGYKKMVEELSKYLSNTKTKNTKHELSITDIGKRTKNSETVDKLAISEILERFEKINGKDEIISK